MTSLEQIDYQGWPHCYRLSNAHVALIVTTDVGPRIIRFGFVDGDNEFAEVAETLGQTGGDEWRIYGGHRLWHAPEATPRTYYPDNQAVSLEQHNGFIRVVQPVEPTTGIQKEMDIALQQDAAHVQVVHRLRNRNPWAVELAPWALSVMAPGGTAVIPLPPRGPHPQHLQPTSSLTLWAYTDMADPRWTWGSRHILLRQDAAMESPQKVGASVPDGWAAYARGGHLFLKAFTHTPDAPYPDLGCSVEVFTNAWMLELETLGPLAKLPPGAAVEHVEHWFLYRDVAPPQSEEDIARDILPRVGVAKAQANI